MHLCKPFELCSTSNKLVGLIIDIQPGPNIQNFGDYAGGTGGGTGGGKGKDDRSKSGKTEAKVEDWKQTSFRMFEAAATTAASIVVLGYGFVH